MPVSMIDYYSAPKSIERKQAMENVAQKKRKVNLWSHQSQWKRSYGASDRSVRKSVEDILNTLLNEEADAICNVSRYQQSPDRQDTRAGTYKRKLLTTSGEVELKIPRLQPLPFKCICSFGCGSLRRRGLLKFSALRQGVGRIKNPGQISCVIWRIAGLPE